MKILYDHQAFTMQDFGGVSKIYAETSKYLRDYSDVKLSYPWMISNNDYIYDDKIIGAWTPSKEIKFKGKGTLLVYLRKLNQSFSKQAIRKGDFDIFHPTYYNPYYLKQKIRKPTVVTCYDLIHEKFKQSEVELLAWKKQVLLNSTKIIAISEHTKLDLIDYYGIPSEKIGVSLLGSSFDLIPSQPDYDGPPFFLYVGHRDGYKNFRLFIKAISPLLRSQKNLFLYSAGARPFIKDELALFDELEISGKIKHFGGSNAILTLLYSQAIAFFCPSLYEGFGIPLLEAMSCRCPVVTSNQSSLPEVAGDAAIYFDPSDEESILKAAELVLYDAGLRKEIIDKGIQRLGLFSWEKTARSTYDIYKSLV